MIASVIIAKAEITEYLERECEETLNSLVLMFNEITPYMGD